MRLGLWQCDQIDKLVAKLPPIEPYYEIELINNPSREETGPSEEDYVECDSSVTWQKP